MKRAYWVVVAALAAFAMTGVRGEEKASEKLGWRLGIQCWTFNRKTFFEVVDIAKEVGVKYLEAFPGQKMKPGSNVGMGPGMPPEAIEETKKKLADAGVMLVCFGVGGANKATFEWAKTMGVDVIVTEAQPKELPAIDKLCEEFGISVALHNHPKPSFYWDPATVITACEGRSKRIGACADTGHWPRSGLVPVECLKKLEGRIVSLHFKDLNEKKQDAPWGTGKGDAKAMMAELKRQGFKGSFSIEYEHVDDNLKDNVAKCVAFFEETCKELAK
jgi:sugar phosphate isomerase/epimerase